MQGWAWLAGTSGRNVSDHLVSLHTAGETFSLSSLLPASRSRISSLLYFCCLEYNPWDTGQKCSQFKGQSMNLGIKETGPIVTHLVQVQWMLSQDLMLAVRLAQLQLCYSAPHQQLHAHAGQLQQQHTGFDSSPHFHQLHRPCSSQDFKRRDQKTKERMKHWKYRRLLQGPWMTTQVGLYPQVTTVQYMPGDIRSPAFCPGDFQAGT